MTWRDRTDLWYGTALVRPGPGSDNLGCGGAYVSFFVVGTDIRAALAALSNGVAESGWTLTSLLKMMRAFDFEETEKVDEEFDAQAREAELSGLTLGAFHVFPKEKQRAQ